MANTSVEARKSVGSTLSVSPAAHSSVKRQLLPLYNALVYLIRRFEQIITARLEEKMAAGVGLTRAQFAILIVVVLAPGLEQAEIAKLVSYDAATTGNVISRLESMGLIRRARSTRSRRGWIVESTPSGFKLVEQRLSVLDSLQLEVLSPLKPDERLTVLRLLSQVVGISNSYNSGSEPPAAPTLEAGHRIERRGRVRKSAKAK